MVMGRFVAAMFGLMSLAAPSWAQAPLKAAGQDVAPWAVHEKSTGALSGVFVDLTNAIAKDAGLQVGYQVMTFADLIPAVTSGKINIIATEMAITPARAEQVDFSIPVYIAPREALVVLASEKTDYRSLEDIKKPPGWRAEGKHSACSSTKDLRLHRIEDL
jgi:polar amino acid transport system substrate-binding protein